MRFNPDPTKQAQKIIFSRKTTKKIHPKIFQLVKSILGNISGCIYVQGCPLTFISKQIKAKWIEL